MKKEVHLVTLENTCKWAKSAVFPNEYLVCENGDVFSIRTGKKLKPSHDKNGYLYYVLCVNKNRKTVKAHRLVAKSFIPNPECKPSVDHINGIKQDNRVCNLRWVTNKENTNNPITIGKVVSSAMLRIPKMYEAAKKNNFGRKAVVVDFETETARFDSLKEASKAVGISCSKLSEMLNGKREQNKGFTAIWASEIEEFPIAVTKEHFPEEE